ncbi:hypothetical protein BDY24DRAFT_395845 [Mrakia frigida]|uniref:LIM domain-containing protein n=1 Tax=Mrakia frigida TaxID=29902 RepID=UPI003FCBFBCE
MSTLCALCRTPAYAAEQCIGPGRKVYHKTCLKCTNCNKRLDSHLLVEHDEMPYCKQCHVKLFGTRDLRSHNHPQATPALSSTSSPTSPTFASNPPTPPRPSFLPPPSQTYLSSPKPRPPLPTTPKPHPTSARQLPSAPSPPPPLSPASAGTGFQPVKERSAASLAVGGGARTGGWKVEGGGTPRCRGCGGAVYHAETVIALDSKWHARCLRCSICSTTVPANKVAEHDGAVCCKNCYATTYGPLGGGYALR